MCEPLRWKPCLGLKLKDMPSLLLRARATATDPGTGWEGTGDGVVSGGRELGSRKDRKPFQRLCCHTILFFLKNTEKTGKEKHKYREQEMLTQIKFQKYPQICKNSTQTSGFYIDFWVFCHASDMLWGLFQAIVLLWHLHCSGFD